MLLHMIMYVVILHDWFILVACVLICNTLRNITELSHGGVADVFMDMLNSKIRDWSHKTTIATCRDGKELHLQLHSPLHCMLYPVSLITNWTTITWYVTPSVQFYLQLVHYSKWLAGKVKTESNSLLCQIITFLKHGSLQKQIHKPHMYI